MAIDRNDNLNIKAPKIMDARYGPYTSLAAAKAAVPIAFRKETLKVAVDDGNSRVEYWWEGGVTDDDLVPYLESAHLPGEPTAPTQPELDITDKLATDYYVFLKTRASFQLCSRMKIEAYAATTQNITLSGNQTIDGVAVPTGKKVVVQFQDDPTENGPYNTSNNAWIRSLDCDQPDPAYLPHKLYNGSLISIANGDTYGGKTLRMNAPGNVFDGRINIGTDPITYEVAFENGADITNAQNIADAVSSAANKAQPVAADILAILDSQDSNSLKNITIQQILDMVPTRGGGDDFAHVAATGGDYATVKEAIDAGETRITIGKGQVITEVADIEPGNGKVVYLQMEKGSRWLWDDYSINADTSTPGKENDSFSLEIKSEDGCEIVSKKGIITNSGANTKMNLAGIGTLDFTNQLATHFFYIAGGCDISGKWKMRFGDNSNTKAYIPLNSSWKGVEIEGGGTSCSVGIYSYGTRDSSLFFTGTWAFNANIFQSLGSTEESISLLRTNIADNHRANINGKVGLFSSEGSGILDIKSNRTYFETPQFRLSLQASTPVPDQDLTAKTTLYIVPYKGNSISFCKDMATYGYGWEKKHFAEVSYTPGTLTPLKMHDVFVYDNQGILDVDIVEWTDNSNRAEAIAVIEGGHVKNSDKGKLLLGCFYTDATGLLQDTKEVRGLWNLHNQVEREHLAFAAENSMTTTSTTFQPFSGNADNKGIVISGLKGNVANVLYGGINQSNGGYGYVRMNHNGTPHTDDYGSVASSNEGLNDGRKTFRDTLEKGVHTLTTEYRSNGSSMSFLANSANQSFKCPILSGMWHC